MRSEKLEGITHREPCPKCRENGKDTHGDNFVVWEDGHGHCFSCKFTTPPTWRFPKSEEKSVNSSVTLPDDASNNIDFKALTWLGFFDIEIDEIVKHRILWSSKKKLLIFPIYSSLTLETLLAWQGRKFDGDANDTKYVSYGPIHDIIVPLGPKSDTRADKIILVEDYVSAIKVARCFPTACLFGSYINPLKLKRFRILTDELIFWLDNDKAATAVNLANSARQLGFRTRVIVTKDDPKFYTNSDIQNAINA